MEKLRLVGESVIELGRGDLLAAHARLDRGEQFAERLDVLVAVCAIRVRRFADRAPDVLRERANNAAIQKAGPALYAAHAGPETIKLTQFLFEICRRLSDLGALDVAKGFETRRQLGGNVLQVLLLAFDLHLLFFTRQIPQLPDQIAQAHELVHRQVCQFPALGDRRDQGGFKAAVEVGVVLLQILHVIHRRVSHAA